MKMKAPKPRNPVAREMMDPRFRSQVVRSKKAYSRKARAKSKGEE